MSSPRPRPSYGKPKPTPLGVKLVKIMLFSIGLLIAPALAVVLVGFGLLFGILFSWINRALTKQ
jgi:hypothetical protein